jgi:hypothetical protein
MSTFRPVEVPPANAKLEPRIVATAPPDRGAFAGVTTVTRGASYVKMLLIVPTVFTKVAETSCDIPLPTGLKQLTVVSVDHDVVRQADAPNLADGVGSNAVTKLNPVSVILAKPDVGALTLATPVRTAVSYVKLASRVAVWDARARFADLLVP